MSVLNMAGGIDGVFQSVPATRTTNSTGSYVDGIWVPGVPVTTDFIVNIQPVSQQELDFLTQGGERVLDLRRVYVNDGPLDGIDETGIWEFLGKRWKAIRVDNRPWRNYCKCIVSREDVQQP